MGERLGYARVSTVDQNAELQLDALAQADCYRVFVEWESTRNHRPELEECLDQLRPGDTLVVWRLDRLGRSLRELIDTIDGLALREIGFQSLTEAIDTTTPGGRLTFHVFGALAEFERDLTRERTMARLAAARARGRTGGRPPALSPKQVKAVRVLADAQTMTITEIATEYGVSRNTIYRALKDSPTAKKAA